MCNPVITTSKWSHQGWILFLLHIHHVTVYNHSSCHKYWSPFVKFRFLLFRSYECLIDGWPFYVCKIVLAIKVSFYACLCHLKLLGHVCDCKAACLSRGHRLCSQMLHKSESIHLYFVSRNKSDFKPWLVTCNC